MRTYKYLRTKVKEGRKIKGCVSLRSKCYARPVGDTIELWARKPDEGGLLVAVIAHDSSITVTNLEHYDNKAFALLSGWGGILARRLTVKEAKNRNYKTVFREGRGYVESPLVSGQTIFADGTTKNGITPMTFTTSASTEKAIKARIAEWRGVMNLVANLLKKDVQRGEWALDFPLPTITDEVDGGVALKMLEWSRRRTAATQWKVNYDEEGRFISSSYVDAENFVKNLVEKCLVRLRDKWREEAPDSVWTPIPMKG